MTDPIADMLTRIRNAQMVKKSEVIMPFSKLKFNILSLLAKQGWVEDIIKIEPGVNKIVKLKSKKMHRSDTDNRFASLQVKLKYESDKRPKITSLKRISKPGCRIYVNKDKIPTVLGGRGILIISTSQGLLTDKEAKKNKVGGEIICEIY